MKEAIELTIEGGWNWLGNSNQWQMFCDPLFWKALGKSLGWNDPKQDLSEFYDMTKNEGYILGDAGQHIPTWIFHWHLFIDHLASEKPVNDFFKALLDNK